MKIRDFVLDPKSSATDFYLSKWCKPGARYLVYRSLVFCYWCVAFIVDLCNNLDGGWFFIYLSHWGESLVLLYFFTALCTSICGYLQTRREREKISSILKIALHSREEIKENETENVKNRSLKLKWFHYLTTILFIASFNVSITVTILYPILDDVTYHSASFLSINIHILNFILMLIDLCVNGINVKFQQFFISVITSAMYAATLVTLHLTGANSAVYPAIDYKQNPIRTSLVTVAMILIAPVLCHSVMYCIYRLKLCIGYRIRRRTRTSVPVMAGNK
uniref:Protein rolling stone-like n=1 Tax=Ciona intestinalis TaxID=7719 RepID=F7AYH7_CIOIN|nr:protein rolling stone-like [Ciona intestinalis]|eukprot:XP_002129554.1 protein rolling stone-like [Ciona intestinalis]